MSTATARRLLLGFVVWHKSGVLWAANLIAIEVHSAAPSRWLLIARASRSVLVWRARRCSTRIVAPSGRGFQDAKLTVRGDERSWASVNDIATTKTTTTRWPMVQ